MRRDRRILISTFLWASTMFVASSLIAQPVIVVGAVSEEENKRAVELLQQISRGEAPPQLSEFTRHAEGLGFTVEVQDGSWFVLPRSVGSNSIYGYAASLLRGLKELSSVPGKFRFDELPPSAREACREILLRTVELANDSRMREALLGAFGKAAEEKPLALTLMEARQLMVSIQVALRPRIGIGERLLRVPPVVLFTPRSSPLPPDIQARVNELLASSEKTTLATPDSQEINPSTPQMLFSIPSSWLRADELREYRGVAFTRLTIHFSNSVKPTQAAQLGQKYLQRIERLSRQAQESYKKAMRELIEHWKSHNSFLKEILPQPGRVPFSSLHPYLQRQLIETMRGSGDYAELQSQLMNNGWFELSADDVDIVICYPAQMIETPGVEGPPVYDWRGYFLSDLMR